MFKYYLPYITFFVIFFAAALPILYYIQRKHPDPRFRPNFGEMSLITIIAIFICGGMAVGLGGLFKPENDGSALKGKPTEGAGWSAIQVDPDSKSKSRKKEKSSDGPRRLNEK